MSPADRDLLWKIIQPVVDGVGVDLEELSLARAGRRHRLQVIVDADGGVDLDRCAEISRLVSHALDESDAMGDTPYTLEVSSPGVSRPLTMPRHWSRALGRLVRVTLTDGGEVTGRVQAADDDAAVLDVDGADREIAYGDVAMARVQVELNHVAGAETG